MVYITKKDLKEMEEYYYWCGYKEWPPFPKELKQQLLEAYGQEPLPHTWTHQDIYEGSRKIILKYFQK
ncbi:hypothetical protein AJ85_21570 [Alkalihalobacillus alcalophilus ATCC 27647 = CGMCC 1.3604]|uniref:Uncharacterized protein n=1 Tax=Alkalihalobacillus alcalophilus ATCC 27647 = CGMCC 1.3604 TaxID=1218173 RepID=A0A094WL21_ALKAL|nr:hypothetical protein [Alkalihalobacillus alcalophilus]KGA96638.1 hypothetical protein BALCAV_0215055 [Alkalihalobacillus alcalophilus ATCC 27647 = CGMCC 1.3604]THG91978.1 hypothetical protein AJ85_21570 [Alkalihalobacillus alcalophilus ATCC 27647 = CGMCC 1.3604]